MSIDLVTLSLAKAYANLVAAGLTSVSVSGTTVTFTLTNGQKASVTLPTPADGAPGLDGQDAPVITSGVFNDSNNLILTFDDGTTVDCGPIHIKNSAYDDTKVKSDIAALQSDNTQIKSDISNLQSDNTQIKSDISDLQTDNTQNKSDISDLQSDISTLTNGISDINDTIGDFSQITISASTIVDAINLLVGKFMKSITYNSSTKELVIDYQNGTSSNIDLSAIITDASIGELKDVNIANINDNEVLAYKTTTGKFQPIDIVAMHDSVLANAKKYTDDEIVNSHKDNAVFVSALPADPEERVWYYYQVDSVWYQTIYISGHEITISPGSVSFDGVLYDTDLESGYTETTDSAKVASIGSLKDLHAIIKTALGDKVNTADIIDSLVSTDATRPLSSNQGKVLNDNKFDKSNIKDAFSVSDTNDQVPGLQFIHTELNKKLDSTLKDNYDAAYTHSQESHFDGDYNSLTNTPTIPTVTNDLTDDLKANYDAAYAHSQSAHFSGSYNDLTDTPTIPTPRTDAEIKTLADGQISAKTSYSLEEQLTGGTWIDGKPIYRKVINFGGLPNIDAKDVSHGITNIGTVIKVYGIASDGTGIFIPLPFPDAAADGSVSAYCRGEVIRVTSATDRTNFAESYIAIEYTKTTD